MKILDMPHQGLPVTQAKDIAADPAFGAQARIQTDVVVVGSGAGGAVAAYELAKTGRSVLVLESGRYKPSTEFTEILGDSMRTLYANQGAQLTTTGDTIILQGACIGGSTVVNACIADRAPEKVLQSWKDNHGLDDLTLDKLAPYYDKIEDFLHIHINEQHEINPCAHKVIQGCERMQFSWRPLSRVVRECALTGHCLSGCASDRNQSMLVTYLPWATAYGARIFSDTMATRIRRRNGRAVGVDAIVRDPDSRQIVSRLQVDAQLVVVAAGAIQTPMLLQRSEIPDDSGQLGKNLALHPFVQILGKFKDPVYGWRGALTGVAVDEFLETDGFEFVSGLAEPEQLLIQGDQGAGAKQIEFMKDYNYLAGLNAFVHDEGTGKVTWKGGVEDGEGAIHWGPTLKDFSNIKRATALASRIMFSAGAEKVYLPTFEQLSVNSVFELDDTLKQVDYGVAGLFTFRSYGMHPQGTCRMGKDPQQSVVNEYGETHRTKGLFVADASLFPSELNVSPQLTIYAMSNYIADQIVKRSKDYFIS